MQTRVIKNCHMYVANVSVGIVGCYETHERVALIDWTLQLPACCCYPTPRPIPGSL